MRVEDAKQKAAAVPPPVIAAERQKQMGAVETDSEGEIVSQLMICYAAHHHHLVEL